jgi:hypothetical protein
MAEMTEWIDDEAINDGYAGMRTGRYLRGSCGTRPRAGKHSSERHRRQ